MFSYASCIRSRQTCPFVRRRALAKDRCSRTTEDGTKDLGDHAETKQEEDIAEGQREHVMLNCNEESSVDLCTKALPSKESQNTSFDIKSKKPHPPLSRQRGIRQRSSEVDARNESNSVSLWAPEKERRSSY